MMIKFSDETVEPLVRAMWKECFGDSDVFIDLYFSTKYKHANTLVYFVDDIAVASLQMIPYSIFFHGKSLPFYYLSGLCTLPPFRGKGYMGSLIRESHRVMAERGIPLSILIPAGDHLRGYYEKHGYEQVFEGGGEVIPLKELLLNFPDMEDAYGVFDEKYNSRDFCVRKTFDDFTAIVKDSEIDGFPPKHNLPGMARIIDTNLMLDYYAARKLYKEPDPQARINIKIHDDAATECYRIQYGFAEITEDKNIDYEVDIRMLCRLLFGYKTMQLPEIYRADFPEHNPVMNLMLE